MVSAPFSSILAAGRSRFNQRMADARRRHAGLSTEGFGQFLVTCIDPIVSAVALVDSARAPAVALAAYDMGLELTGLGLVGPGARSPFLATVWRTLAPRLAGLIVHQPAEVLGLLSNAALYIESIARTRCPEWIAQMAALSGQMQTIPQFQAVGQIAAWRCGVAHFRDGAIEAGDRLPEAVALSAFGATGTGSWQEVRAQALADPWWKPGAIPTGIETGAFSGFGGEFSVPPEVRAHPHGFTVKSGGAYYLLVADAYGAVLHPSDQAEHDVLDAAKGEWKLKGSVLHVGEREILLDLPAEGIKICCNGQTLAIASPYTHAIRLVPAR